jgi:two-component system sensor histidine kinase ChiS
MTSCSGLLEKKTLTLFLTLAILCICLTGCKSSSQTPPTAHRGVLDLTSWDFARDGTVELSGEWQFFGQSLLSPSALSGNDTLKHADFFSAPGFWADHVSHFEQTPAHGFATYRLLIKTQAPQPPLVLLSYGVMAADRLWVNGKLRREDGKVSGDSGTVVPGQLLVRPIHLSDSDIATGTIELVIQGSVSKYWMGGMPEPLKLGPESQIIRQLEHQRCFLVFFSSLLLFMGCFHLVLFFSRRQDPSTLFFSLFCLTWVVTIVAGAANRWLIFLIFPDLSLYSADHIETIGYYFTVPLILFFLQALFPDETPKWLAKAHLVLAIILTPLAFTPQPLYGVSLTVAHIVTGCAICSVSIILVKALHRRRQSATLLTAGGITLAICGAGDVLTQLDLIKTVYLTPFGLLIFVSCQACAIALRFSKTFARTEALSLELRDKNIRLSQLDALKDEFLANTSHELRTPLSGIIGIAESMRAGATGSLPASAMTNLDLVLSSGRRLSNLVNDILDFSRLNNKDLSLNLKPVDLATVAESVCAVLSPLATGKGISIINRLDNSLPLVQADEDRLQQIFFNLIGNGIKFTPAGSLTITAEQNNNLMQVEITDTGIGIARDKLKDIFLSFEQVDSAETRTYGGTGLGLSITKDLVELHKGILEVQSELGKGTTFFLNLPVAEQTAESDISSPDTIRYQPSPLPAIGDSVEPVPCKELPPPSPDAPTVLAVDDEPVNLQVAVNQLGLAGFNVVTAANGAEALAICQEKLPDLILLDLMMPGMSGYQVCEHLRETHSASTLPIIIVTARNRTTDLLAGFESGANDYLTKPFTSGELLVRVRSHLQLKKSYLALEENSRLKKELKQRQETELELRLTQRRLAVLLDTIDNALLATNESEEICFCNKVCCELLGYDNNSLLGRPLKSLLIGKALCLLDNLGTNSPDDGADSPSASYRDIEIKAKNGTHKNVDVERTLLFMEEDIFQIFMIHQPTGHQKNGRKLNGSNAHTPPLALIKDLNHNQIRLRGLEDTLNTMLPVTSEQPTIILDEIKAIDTALVRMNEMLQDPQTPEGRRQLAVTAMNLAMEYWTETTGNDKFELARQSGLWKVYTNQDGWERAQTLDKYLNINTLPARPRWKLIMATCNFVLASSIESSALRNQLEEDLSKMRAV